MKDVGEENTALLRACDYQDLDDWPAEPPRRRWRLRRADLACLAVIGIVASFVSVRQPELRPDNPLWGHTTAHCEQADDVKQFRYMTYDDIDAEKRRSGYTVTYTQRGFEIDGKATILLGGSIHYPRSTPGMWEDLLLKAKHDGLNHVELYVFWNFHQPEPDTFHLRGRHNLTHFYDLAAKVGLFLHVRFGPYVCAEWNNGGLPLWLNWISGMDVRSNSSPWKVEMERFVEKMVELSRPYLAQNGGPIILAQIENEFTADDVDYINWCGSLISRLNTSIPWVMCNGKAADNTILACNGNDCVDFALKQSEERPSEPFMWTENEGWYQKWGVDPENEHSEQNSNRDPKEVAYAVARWFAIGGAHHNYYMYHGGNNYGRSASAGVTTMYADGVNLHADGLSNEPKRSHLRKLHEALIACNEVLLSTDRQLHHPHPLDSPEHRAYVYKTSSSAIVFVENTGDQDAFVHFNGSTLHIASHSVVIIKDGQVIFDTADVRGSYPHRQHRLYTPLIHSSSLNWNFWTEHGDTRKNTLGDSPLEQLSVTRDKTDYLTYETKFTPSSRDVSSLSTSLTFTGCDANGYLVFLDGTFVKEVNRPYPGENCTKTFTVDVPILHTNQATHTLSVTSVSLGIHSLGKNHHKGITSDVTIGDQRMVFGTHQWTMYPGLIGEELKIYEPKWSSSVSWSPVDRVKRRVMTWYRTSFRFDRPPKSRSGAPVEETSTILLDCSGLTRGRIYINGHDLGRFWTIQNDDGSYVQRYYHIPADWLQANHSENELVIFDELGGSVAGVQVVLSTMVDDVIDPVFNILGNRAFQVEDANPQVVALRSRPAA